jgi:hypothetical protein
LLLLSYIPLALLPWSLALEAVFPMESLKLMLVENIFIAGFAKLKEGQMWWLSFR